MKFHFFVGPCLQTATEMALFVSLVVLGVVETVVILFASKRFGTTASPSKLKFQQLVEWNEVLCFSWIAQPIFLYLSFPYVKPSDVFQIILFAPFVVSPVVFAVIVICFKVIIRTELERASMV